MQKNKAVFLDRDGVLNKDFVDYVWSAEKLFILDGVSEALIKLKNAGYKLIVITNQSGIAKGIYKREDVVWVHEEIQRRTGVELDELYFCPYHEKYDTQSLIRKPSSLMIERGIAKFNIDVEKSWMIGDHERDIEAGKKVNLKTIRIADFSVETKADFTCPSLLDATTKILN